MTKDKTLPCFFKNKWGTYSATQFSPPNEPTNTYSAIVFAHGLGAQKEWYQWIGEYLADHGYFTLLFTVPSKRCIDPRQWSEGITSAIDYLLGEPKSIHAPIYPETIGVMGHSMGGLGALIAGSEDPRITCIVGLAPAILPKQFSISKEIFRGSSPIHLQIGSNDGIIPPENVKAFFTDLCSTQKSFLEIKGGNHMRFLDNTAISRIGEYMTQFGLLGRRLKDGKAQITFDEQHTLSRKGFIEWFNQHLHS